MRTRASVDVAGAGDGLAGQFGADHGGVLDRDLELAHPGQITIEPVAIALAEALLKGRRALLERVEHAQVERSPSFRLRDCRRIRAALPRAGRHELVEDRRRLEILSERRTLLAPDMFRDMAL